MLVGVISISTSVKANTVHVSWHAKRFGNCKARNAAERAIHLYHEGAVRRWTTNRWSGYGASSEISAKSGRIRYYSNPNTIFHSNTIFHIKTIWVDMWVVKIRFFLTLFLHITKFTGCPIIKGPIQHPDDQITRRVGWSSVCYMGPLPGTYHPYTGYPVQKPKVNSNNITFLKFGKRVFFHRMPFWNASRTA